MRNGNIALGIGILVVALLAAEGKLQTLWTAVMSAGGSDAGAVPPGGSSPSGPTKGSNALAPFAPLTPAQPFGPLAPAQPAPDYGIPKLLNGPQNANLTPFPSQPGMPGYSAVERVFAMWPAGRQSEWDAFKTCYVQTGGNIADCAARGFVLSTGGVG